MKLDTSPPACDSSCESVVLERVEQQRTIRGILWKEEQVKKESQKKRPSKATIEKQERPTTQKKKRIKQRKDRTRIQIKQLLFFLHRWREKNHNINSCCSRN